MARKPNYRFERHERERIKAEKKAARDEAKASKKALKDEREAVDRPEPPVSPDDRKS